MNITIDLFTLIAIVFVSILLFIALIIITRTKKTLKVGKDGIIIDNNDLKNKTERMYYISEITKLNEKYFMIENIEKIEAMMTYTEQVLDVFYGNIIVMIKNLTPSNKINEIDFYIYRIALFSNRDFVKNEIKKEYKKIDSNIIQNYDNYVEHLKKYFWNKTLENLDFLLKSELRELAIDNFRSEIQKIFFKDFPCWMQEIKYIYIEYEMMLQNIEKNINETIQKMLGVCDVPK